MEPSITDAIVYYSAVNPKRALRAHIECLVPDNCSLLTVSFVAVNNNIAVATFEMTQCTGTATSLTTMEADANIVLAVDYDENHQTKFVLLFDGGKKERTVDASNYIED
ncbi:MAG: hypothetical protein L3J31_07365 [Bacteroidales bacterium]|nr:hypothetical protein [Bacteroidales bacterium]